MNPKPINGGIPNALALSEWDAKMRDRRRANERPGTRKLREAAESPDATAPKLSDLWETARQQWMVSGQKNGAGIILTMEAVACHPNTPPEVLADLLPVCARAFCSNPVTPFLLLEQPGFVAGLGEKTQHALLREADAPPLFIQMLAEGGAAQSKAVQQAARLHVAFKGKRPTFAAWRKELHEVWEAECVEIWGAKGKEWCAAELMGAWLGPKWAVRAKPLYASPSLAHFPALDTWFRFAHTPDSPEEVDILKRIGPKMEPFILARGLGSDATSADLQILLHTPGSDAHLIPLAILRHPSVTADIIAEVAGAQGENYQQVVVRHPQTPAPVLGHILQSSNSTLRRLARRHPNAPPNVHEIVRQSFIDFVQKPGASVPAFVVCVARSNGLPQQRIDLTQKAEHYHWAARLEAALLADGNDDPLPGDPAKRTGLDLLTHLSRDGNRIVRAAAQKRLVDPNYQFFLASPTDAGTPLL